MGILKGKKIKDGYLPSLLHRFFTPDISGNTINGLGEQSLRRPTPIYHWFKDKPSYPFKWIERLFILNNSFSWRGQKLVIEALNYLKQPFEPVADAQVERSPEDWTRQIKQFILANGADAVGIARLREDWVFEGKSVNNEWIIVLGFHPDYEVFSTVPETEGELETLRTYNRGHRTAVKLANWIRRQGTYAYGYGAPFAGPVNLVPAALAAGLGELGKHGSIISRKFGSAFRLAYVLTDIPLLEDTADEFGADDFCVNCQVCSKACPPRAIFAEKQKVRGVEKWYVDFDKCIPFFNDTLGCGICIAVCPWSRPGVADRMVAKMARRRERT